MHLPQTLVLCSRGRSVIMTITDRAPVEHLSSMQVECRSPDRRGTRR